MTPETPEMKKSFVVLAKSVWPEQPQERLEVVLAKDYENAIRERNELAEALRNMMRLYESKWSDEPPALVQARAALSKVEKT